MSQKHVLIVDDSIEMLEVLRRHLSAMNYQTFQATNVSDAVEILKSSAVDLLITDLQMPGINGMQLVKYAAERFPSIPILVITGFPSIAEAVDAINLGKIDYLTKPFTREELRHALEKTWGKVYQSESSENNLASSQFGIVGSSPKMLALFDMIRRVANVRVTTLIQGESGTGKELVARALHYAGKDSAKPFIAVNCGAIPENLLESELFGYAKGAFTGADENRTGLFQAAHGGTIFLDEIGNASLAVQARLLRVIQEKEITKVGSTSVEKVDVRIIAATNANLLHMAQNGSFREDLYYRLNVIGIEIPPLRERKSDLPALISFFAQKFAKEYTLSEVIFSKEAQIKLSQFSWPGNVRELENVIQRLAILTNGKVDVADLPAYLIHADSFVESTFSEMLPLKELEKKYIAFILKQCDDNKTKAAEILGIDRKTLRQKIST